jgi:hypothetical protein
MHTKNMYPAHKANDDTEKSPFVIVGLGVGLRQSSVKAVASDSELPNSDGRHLI